MELSVEDRTEVANQMKGMDVIWNHKGTNEHVTDGKSFQQLGAVEPIKGPIGKVVEAWVDTNGTGRAVVDVQPRIGAFIGSQVAPGVSLSHGYDDSGRIRPVELSVTDKPARSGAVFEHGFATPAAAQDYIQKAQAAVSTNMDTNADAAASTPAPAAVPPSLIELGVNSIADEAQRAAVTKRFEELASQAIDKTRESKDLQGQLDRYQQQSGTDAAATREALEMYLGRMPEEHKSRWRLGALEDYNEPQWPTGFVRSMLCASHDRISQLEQQLESAAPATAPNKRARAEESATPRRPTMSNPLRSALASTFYAN